MFLEDLNPPPEKFWSFCPSSARTNGHHFLGARRGLPVTSLGSPGPACLSRAPGSPASSPQRRRSPSQVLQGGGLESPTKPKGRPKKNSIPTSEQLTEQERAKEAEKTVEAPGEASDRSHED